MARTKRVRLQQGKGVKKDGMYIHSDQAASFDSLPPGPDANTIAKDVHDILPKLTKKGTLFRAGKDTIDQRGKEFKALIEKLWEDDVPTLIQELRETRLVRDFFGYWRRDKDHDKKAAAQAGMDPNDKGKNRISRASVASSAFSMYFSASNISLQLPNSYSDYPPSPAVSTAFTSPPSTPGSEKPPNSAARTSTSKKAGPSLPSSPSGSTPRQRVVSVPQSISANSVYSNIPRTPVSPTSHISFTVADNGTLVPTSPPDVEEALNSAIVFVPEPEPRGKTIGGLGVLPEEQEAELAEATADMSLASSSTAAPSGTPTPPAFSPALRSAPPLSAPQEFIQPTRRPRNLSCPDPGVRNGLVFSGRPPRPQSVISERSVLNSPGSVSSSDGAPSDFWEDAQDEFLSEQSEGEQSTLSRRASVRRSVASTRSLQRGTPPRPFTMYSTFSSISQRDDYFDDLDLGENFDIEEMLEAGAASEGEATMTRRAHHPRASVATMNSIMSNSSVDAVLPRRGFSMSPRPLSLHRAGSPTPSLTASTYVRSASPTPSSSPSFSILQTPDGNVRRSMSNGSRKSRTSIVIPETNLEEGKWYEGEELPDEDFIDSYFYGTSPALLNANKADVCSDPGQRPAHSGYETPRRERVSQVVTQISTPEHFPKPFQHRPPGQFHLPWSPTDSSRTSQASLSPSLSTPSSVSVSGEHFTIKAVRQDSIVLLRATYAMSLAQVRERLRDKFAAQEGIRLTDAFNIGFNPAPGDVRQPATVTGRPRSQSTSALGAKDGQPRLRFIMNDDDWEEATASCTGKLTIHIFDRF